MRIASYMHDSIVDGPGLRFVVFVQGCSRNCPGCHNPETHDPNGGREVSVNDLAAEMLKNPLCEGLTISGGEPFDQAWECALLAMEAAKAGKSTWVYTGYKWEDIKRQAGDDNDWDALLICADVVVDGPFVEELKSYEARFRGSTNQRLINVSPSLWTDEPVLWEPKDRGLDGFEVPE